MGESYDRRKFVLKKLPNCFSKWLYNLHPVFNFQEVAMALFIPFSFSCFPFWTTRSLKVERDHVSPNGPLGEWPSLAPDSSQHSAKVG